MSVFEICAVESRKVTVPSTDMTALMSLASTCATNGHRLRMDEVETHHADDSRAHLFVGVDADLQCDVPQPERKVRPREFLDQPPRRTLNRLRYETKVLLLSA